MNIFGLVGAGGFAKEVMPILLNLKHDFNEIVHVINDKDLSKKINGIDVMTEEMFLQNTSIKHFNIAIGNQKESKKIAKVFISEGCTPVQLIGHNCYIESNAEIGCGAIICGNSIIQSSQIGDFFHCNLSSYVAHDCIIEDYVTFAPNVACNGNIHIKSGAYIGTGAIIKQGSESRKLTIGEGAIVGMGAVVTKDVAPQTTVVGNPARIMNSHL